MKLLTCRNLLFIPAVVSVFACTAPLLAGTTVKAVIPMETKGAYDVRKQPVVNFTHEKHATAYGITCGECHHDATGKPLDLKPGDDVASCLGCHKPGKAPAPPKGTARDERKKMEIAYHYGAIHENCVACHKDVNEKKTGSKIKGPAPATCKTCHIK